MKKETVPVFQAMQRAVVEALEAFEPECRFAADPWKREDSCGVEGGGGLSRVLTGGEVFERAGVNFSEVSGVMPARVVAMLCGESEEAPFFAAGTSLVIHPRSPMVPTVHANVRYLEVGDRAWFGGGADLTPYYLVEEDVRHFHETLKSICERHDAHFYPRFKKECDGYFYLPHRGECRGVGGIFFDYLGRDDGALLPKAFGFVRDLAAHFSEAYLPIVSRRMHEEYGAREREFQLMRRGRYAEFNLLYDRGTHFGLGTNGRAESILMSLPPLASWVYDFQPVEGSREASLLEVLKAPRDWAAATGV